jgi:hypothetical protein
MLSGAWARGVASVMGAEPQPPIRGELAVFAETCASERIDSDSKAEADGRAFGSFCRTTGVLPSAFAYRNWTRGGRQVNAPRPRAGPPKQPAGRNPEWDAIENLDPESAKQA